MNNVICIMGPTAAGKTAIAIELTKKLPLEIISVDSTMVYRGLDIGSAKPTAQELIEAPHRLIDICDPSEAYSAGRFRDDALDETEAIFQKGKIPLLVGGTMLYFHVLQHGVADLPPANNEIRQRISKEAKRVGWPIIHQRLAEVDPEAAAKINSNDSQRLQRALEVYEITGFKISELQNKTHVNSQYKFINIVIAPKDRHLLHDRIAKRFAAMLHHGFLEEVRKLYTRGDLSEELPAIRSAGYRQAWQYLAGKIDEQTMREQAVAATRQLAKRQLTWLRRRWADAKWFEMTAVDLEKMVHQYLLEQVSM
jgi:tRNA dimethylallyltransferase